MAITDREKVLVEGIAEYVKMMEKRFVDEGSTNREMFKQSVKALLEQAMRLATVVSGGEQ